MWEVGVVEGGSEYRWDPKQYRLSCGLLGLMMVAITFFGSDLEAPVSATKIFDHVIMSSKGKPSIFRRPTRDEFFKQVGTDLLLTELLEYICSRCMVAVCLNRQAEFYDKKLFNTVIRRPWKVS